jgi:hypothetical protein
LFALNTLLKDFQNIFICPRLKYFEGQTIESCSSDSCLLEIFAADILAGKSPPIEACEKIKDSELKKECLLRYDAFTNDNFYACLEITSNIGLGLSTQQISPVVFERDYCYTKVATQKENKYVHASSYIGIYVNEPWNAYSPEECAQETRIAAKNYCYYVIGKCSRIESAEIMQEDCRTFYTNYYLDHYDED